MQHLRVGKEEKYLFFSILDSMSSQNFMLIRVEHEKSFITSGPIIAYVQQLSYQVGLEV